MAEENGTIKNLTTKAMPCSDEAERSILGAMLLSVDAAETAIGGLTRDDFYFDRHKVIFDAAKSLFSANMPIDMVTVTERMEQHRKLSLSELQYLSELVQGVPSVKNAQGYIDIVKDKSARRNVISAGLRMAALGYDDLSKDTNEIIAESAEILSGQGITYARNEPEHISRAMGDAYNSIAMRAKNGGNIEGLRTGFPTLDKMLAGLKPGQLVIVAGRPGMGKTSFALNIAQGALKHDDPVIVFFSLEMGAEQLAQRLICADAGVDAQKSRTGELNSDDFFAIADAMEFYANKQLYVDDACSSAPQDMMNKCRRLNARIAATHKKIGMIIVDYLQLMRTPKEAGNREQGIAQLTREMKIMAKELGVPVILLSQLSRDAAKRINKQPVLTDLRESGAIEQDADVIIFVHRDDYYKSDDDPVRDGISVEAAKIIVAKQREGPVGTVNAGWIGAQTKYMEMINEMTNSV